MVTKCQCQLGINKSVKTWSLKKSLKVDKKKVTKTTPFWSDSCHGLKQRPLFKSNWSPHITYAQSSYDVLHYKTTKKEGNGTSWPLFQPISLGLSSTIITSPLSPTIVFMISAQEASFIAICLEGFFYGKISVLCALTCTLAKDAQIFLGLGLYSGIFAMYLQCPSRKSRTAIILFYALCLLYVLSTATAVCDLVNIILEVSNNSICDSIIFLVV